MSSQAFDNEVAALRRCEDLFGLPSRQIITQLREDVMRPLPDVLPLRPQWLSFEWPKSGEINLAAYWRDYDRGMTGLL